ncbi:CPBP family intramembrane metalloprotease [Nicoliella spurrieriana]|uniref:CPBP family intramembrane metalloprotease n=1 Tax=Nicoliella spurrieriana TaxID=2925830 RepID=A0A976RSN8_9LACO|nr:CPBP family intramembrane glutamic endopeptidase [Nicoliella spurrieriana]UQS87170.1 CPBP family intramembrane metalloprotease [Nicoliella spurrieriana]
MKKSLSSIIGFSIVQTILILVIAILCIILIPNEFMSVATRYIVLIGIAMILNHFWLKQQVPVFSSGIAVKDLLAPYTFELILILFICYGFEYNYNEGQLINAICFSIGPGIYEEYVFRGLILKALINRFRNANYWGIISAVIISSILFGGMHLINIIGQPVLATILQVITAIIIGIFLAAICIRTKSIIPGMIIHIVSNFVQSSLISSSNWFEILYYGLVIVLSVILLRPAKIKALFKLSTNI